MDSEPYLVGSNRVEICMVKIILFKLLCLQVEFKISFLAYDFALLISKLLLVFSKCVIICAVFKLVNYTQCRNYFKFYNNLFECLKQEKW